MLENLFQTDTEELVRIILAGICVYIGLIILLRISGKRTLSKWNSFDFVVTVAFGSTFASALLTKNISVVEAILAFAVLIGLQFMVTWLSVRFKFFHRMIKSKPSIIFHHGRFLEKEMRRKRVTESEIKAAIRANGHGSIKDIDAVILESDGSFSVIKNSETDPSKSSLSNVGGFEAYINK
ncbi:hypothetical protein C900_01339 [Fulvivirga imtechensis AK7]|uniref:YetF C-terminal domain-containing protein n=1 Tax=Fulvivirga imtechensis AK7 TaxID=1237149 RepID=L8K1D3_9BACT|nr:YetF domain-containing protein [Fulvivirga imtechensis]ELR73729.1 hypothetical protein C900_01339 [Fulvivirga imtechensis AK7]